MMATTYNPTQQASVFELNYMVEYHYPAFELVVATLENPIDIESPFLPQRYEPAPLVPEDSFVHPLRQEVARSPLSSTSKALPGLADSYKAVDYWLPDLDHFTTDMRNLSSCAGKTRLSILVVVPGLSADELAKSPAFVRIARHSELYTFGKGRVTDQAQYAIHFEYLCNDKNNRGYCNEIWYRNIVGLILRENDRASQATDHGFAANRALFQYPERRKWKPKREPKLVPHVADRLSRPQLKKIIETDDYYNLREDEKAKAYECPICQKPFNLTDVVPIQLKITCSHIFCEGCITHWCLEQDLNKAKCPLDRHLITHGDTHLRTRMIRSLDAYGNYISDSRFHPWENFERSCCDLDSENPFRSTAPFIINRQRSMQVWQHFVDYALCEPETSTPTHLNPVRWPDFKFIEKTFASFVHRYDGVGMTNLLFLTIWQGEISTAVSREVMGSPELVAAYGLLRNPAAFGGVELRPGFQKWAMVLLHRVMMFEVKRRCSCDVKGLHLHGDYRMFLSWKYA